MKKNACFAIALVMMGTLMFFTSSCAKKAVQVEPIAMTQQQDPKASDRSAEAAGQARRPTEDRPQAEALAPEAARWAFLYENIHFAFESSLLSDQAKQILKSKAEYLRTNPGIRVTVVGHCDERGTTVYNIALGGRRAESVKNFLVTLGISATRLNTLSYGEERPIAMGQNEASWAKNRRAQFVINSFPSDRKTRMNDTKAKSRDVVFGDRSVPFAGVLFA
jgi:peptidoglycan-associated lipoprotein